jgi:hypothetical protein
MAILASEDTETLILFFSHLQKFQTEPLPKFLIDWVAFAIPVHLKIFETGG